MIKRLFLVLLLICGYFVYAQQVGCKVITTEISGAYSGGCKKGLAHGKGIAQGVDHYEGQFSKGKPDGIGTYTWASGIYYEGLWKNGLKEGEGKMVYKDSVVMGYWKEDKYIGKKLLPSYKITYSMNVSRYTVLKSIAAIEGIKIRLMQGGADNTSIEDFSLIYDSGNEYRNGEIYGIQYARFPLNVKVRYQSWNQFHTSKFNVIFEFIISDPGSWEVVITN